MTDPILREIEAFLRLSGMTPTRFSIEATRDRHFVRTVRAGRRVWPETADRVRAYIRGQTAGARAVADRLSAALNFDAQRGTDAQWTALLTEATNALAFINSLAKVAK